MRNTASILAEFERTFPVPSLSIEMNNSCYEHDKCLFNFEHASIYLGLDYDSKNELDDRLMSRLLHELTHCLVLFNYSACLPFDNDGLRKLRMLSEDGYNLWKAINALKDGWKYSDERFALSDDVWSFWDKLNMESINEFKSDAKLKPVNLYMKHNSDQLIATIQYYECGGHTDNWKSEAGRIARHFGTDVAELGWNDEEFDEVY